MSLCERVPQPINLSSCFGYWELSKSSKDNHRFRYASNRSSVTCASRKYLRHSWYFGGGTGGGGLRFPNLSRTSASTVTLTPILTADITLRTCAPSSRHQTRLSFIASRMDRSALPVSERRSRPFWAASYPAAKVSAAFVPALLPLATI